MPRYTLRHTWPDNPKSQDDYEVLCDGEKVGRRPLALAGRRLAMDDLRVQQNWP